MVGRHPPTTARSGGPLGLSPSDLPAAVVLPVEDVEEQSDRQATFIGDREFAVPELGRGKRRL